MKKILSLLLLIVLSIAFGCSDKVVSEGKTKINVNNQKSEKTPKQEPKTDPINEEQKKNPLPDGSKPYTGVVKKVEGSKVVIDVEGITYEFKVTDKTNMQKGNEPGTGKLVELKPPMKINVLIINGEALTVHYE